MHGHPTHVRRAAIGALLATLAACGDPTVVAQPEFAARRTLSGTTIVVTNTNDVGAGSLRDAIDLSIDGDVITVDPSLSGATIELVNAIRVDRSTVIEGPIGGVTIKATANAMAVLMYGSTGAEVLTMKRVTVTGGKKSGIVILRGSMQLEDCVVEGNEGESAGGINVVAGSLSLLNSIVRNNTSIEEAGGVDIKNGATATITNSTISGNSSLENGGGLRASGGITVTNSTVSGNTSRFSGGGLYAGAVVVVSNSTFSGNNAPTGSNIMAAFQIALEHTTVVGNSSGTSVNPDGVIFARNSIFTSPIANCGLGSSMTLEGVNLFSDNSCSVTGAVPIIADAKLGPLAIDGPTAVHHLLFNSPAINAATRCYVTVDQRGAPRPQGPACDLGSVEEAIQLVVTPTTSASATINSKTGVVLISGRVTCSVDGAVSFNATLEQAQKSGKVNFVLKATTPVQATCVNGAALWSAFTVPTSGAFANGTATVKLAVSGADVVPFNSSTAIRLNWAK